MSLMFLYGADQFMSISSELAASSIYARIRRGIAGSMHHSHARTALISYILRLSHLVQLSHVSLSGSGFNFHHALSTLHWSKVLNINTYFKFVLKHWNMHVAPQSELNSIGGEYATASNRHFLLSFRETQL